MDRLFSFTPYEGSPVQAWFDAVARYMSPYDLNPLNINPLRDLIERFVDFDAVRACKDVSLFISATNVHTGRLRVFPQEKISADVIMASACLPFLFRAVEIDGVPYWDGGYMGNPAIFPFFGATMTEDVLVVQINPVERKATPHTQTEIMNRINEITFNSSLLAEFRAIDFVTRLIDQGKLPRGTGEGQYRRINVHRIALDSTFKELTAELEAQLGFRFLRDAEEGRTPGGAEFPRPSISTTSACAARWIWAPRRRPSGRDPSPEGGGCCERMRASGGALHSPPPGSRFASPPSPASRGGID